MRPKLRRSGTFSARLAEVRGIGQTVIRAMLMTAFVGSASALELAVPEKLERQYGVHPQTIEVIEPHMSTAERQERVTYVALSMEILLTRWFGENWKAPEAEIVFLARDGYRSAIASSRLINYRAYLAFARKDETAFVVDSHAQHEKGIPLGPYYLIWDNRSAPELLRDGAYGWPYQVTRIELHSAAEDRKLLPSKPDIVIVRGFEATKEYCLTCHRIQGVGGEKYPEDLVYASCRWNNNDLKAWIANPGQIRPGTAMPPLNALLPPQDRREMIERIAGYLTAMKTDDPTVCGTASAKP